MNIENLTKYQYRRFKKNNICKICGKEINEETFEMLAVRIGRLVNYNFFHISCLLDRSVGEVVNNAKEEKKQETD